MKTNLTPFKQELQQGQGEDYKEETSLYLLEPAFQTRNSFPFVKIRVSLFYFFTTIDVKPIVEINRTIEKK